MGIRFSISECDCEQNNKNIIYKTMIILSLPSSDVCRRSRCAISGCWEAIASSIVPTVYYNPPAGISISTNFWQLPYDLHWALRFGQVWPGVQCATLHFVVLIALLSLISRSSFWHFGCFSFRLWYSPWCLHVQSTDPSIAMHRVVRMLLFVLCLVPVSEPLASIGPLTEICNKLKSSHSMRRGAGRGAGRGKPDGPKRLPISLGFTVGTSLIHGMPWTFITDTARRLEHSVQIPGTTSPCHSLNEVIKLLGFSVNMIP
jgi:hypothetical protein